MLGVVPLTTGAFGVSRAFGQNLAGTMATVTRPGWARLITPNPFWSLHSEQDPIISRFLRLQADLVDDATAHTVDPMHLDEVVMFPFIFSNDLASVTAIGARTNLREYLLRGGFLYVDGCLDHRVTRSFGEFLRLHTALFSKLVPGTTVRRLPFAHPIFRSFVPVKETELGLLDESLEPERWTNAPQSLYGVYNGDRMISLISLNHLQCEWITKPEKVDFCMQEIANIYLYAMTR